MAEGTGLLSAPVPFPLYPDESASVWPRPLVHFALPSDSA